MAQNYTLKIDAGAHYFLTVWWEQPDGEPMKMNDYTARMMLRKKYSDMTPLISLTSDDNLTITPAEGRVDIVITNIQSGLLSDSKEAKGVYDLEVESAEGIVTRLLGGEWIASPEATK